MISSRKIHVLTRRLIVFVLCATMAIPPALGAPNGKTSTGEISGAAALILYAIEYQVAVNKAKGSAAQAQIVMDAALGDLAFSSPPSDAPTSLTALRSLVKNTVQKGKPVLTTDQRNKFEDFRACYNQVLIGTTASPSPSPSGSPSASPAASTSPKPPSKPSSKPHPKPSPKPAPPVVGSSMTSSHTRPPRRPDATPHSDAKKHPTPKPSTPPKPPASPSPSPSPSPNKSSHSCDTLILDFQPSPAPTQSSDAKNGAASSTAETTAPSPNSNIDIIDLAASLKNAPSLMQQVQDQDVGSYSNDDALRGAFLLQSGYKLISDIQLQRQMATTGAPGAPGLSDLEDVAKNCATQISALACVSSIGSIESNLAKGKSQRISCDWAANVWLPTYTELRGFVVKDFPSSRPPGC